MQPIPQGLEFGEKSGSGSIDLAEGVDGSGGLSTVDLTRQVLDQFEAGLCLINSRKHLLIVNKEGHRILSLDESPNSNRAGRLVFSSDKDGSLFDVMHTEVCGTDSESHYTSLLLDSCDGGSDFFIELSSLSQATSFDIDSNFFCILRVAEVSKAHELSAHKLIEIYQLTTAEASVCQLLVEGYGYSHVALKRGVGIETIKTQVQSIFRKVGVNQRSELIKRAASVRPYLR